MKTTFLTNLQRLTVVSLNVKQITEIRLLDGQLNNLTLVSFWLVCDENYTTYFLVIITLSFEPKLFQLNLVFVILCNAIDKLNASLLLHAKLKLF